MLAHLKTPCMFTRARAFDELGLEDVEVEQGEEGAVDNVTKMKILG